MEEYKSRESYISALEDRAQLPAGFKAGTTVLSFFPEERESSGAMTMNLSLISCNKPCESYAHWFTRNAFPGAPVIVAREREPLPLKALLINNRIANVHAPGGVDRARSLCSAAAELLGCETDSVIPSSTGIIGWGLPEKEIKEALPSLVSSLQSETMLPLAEHIMTTDAWPKLRSYNLPGGSRICAIAKGAGMIEPNLATMLVFILTDAPVSTDDLKLAGTECINHTFNCLSVDSDQSTSDSVFLLSSGEGPEVEYEEFRKGLIAVCRDLAGDIVRNGEGTGHVLKVTVTGASSTSHASGLGKALVNSPLVKTAIAGNDPNVGRLLAAAGDYLGSGGHDCPHEAITIRLGGELVFEKGVFLLDKEKEVRLSRYMKESALPPASGGYPLHDKTVDIEIHLGTGSRDVTILGSDLTAEYVHINADYRT